MAAEILDLRDGKPWPEWATVGGCLGRVIRKGKTSKMFRIVFVVPLILAPLCAQESQEEPRMVDLNIVAVDGHGAPINDLTRDDFQVADAGKPQKIAFFRHRERALTPPPQLGPDEFSNRSAANVPRATLILFDLMNETFATRGATANMLVQDLQALESPDYIYLYLITVNGQLFPVHGLPGSEGEPMPEDGQPWTHHVKPLLDQALRAVLQVRDPGILEDVQYRAEITFRVLDAVAAQLSSVPGRKSIVWLSDGVPIELGPHRSDTGDFVDFTPLLRQMSESMERCGVSIYPVRTIMIGSPSNIDGASHDGMSSLDTLDTFAHMTGGRPDAGKDVGAAVRQAIRDMRTSYQIGYYPPGANWDDKFHKLRITCARKGVHIQAKTGYYAWREAPGTHSNDAMLAALSARFDAGEIGLRARLASDPKTAGARTLEARIDAHDVVLVHEGNAYEGQLRLAIAGMIPGARPQTTQIIPLNLHFSQQERDQALGQGIGFAQQIRLPRDASAIRLIVYDRSSQAVGSVTVPLAASANANH
jgi:VWFA-related protein